MAWTKTFTALSKENGYWDTDPDVAELNNKFICPPHKKMPWTLENGAPEGGWGVLSFGLRWHWDGLGSRLGVWSECQDDCALLKQIFPGCWWVQCPLKARKALFSLQHQQNTLFGGGIGFFFLLHQGILGIQHSLSKVWIREEKEHIP